MKKIIIVFFILDIFFIAQLHIKQMKLIAKRDEYKKAIQETQKNNIKLKKRRDELKRGDYDRIREEALKLGLVKNGERVIRFYQVK